MRTYGKTAPCADAIIKAGIIKVVASIIDLIQSHQVRDAELKGEGSRSGQVLWNCRQEGSMPFF